MNSENKYLKKVENYLNSEGKKIKQDQKRQFIFFVLAFLLSYTILTTLVYLVPSGTFEAIVGNSVNSILITEDLKTSTHASSVFEIFVEDKQIIISWLCAGILEIIILVSAIIASFGIRTREKLIGIIWAVIVGYFFNLLRIIITINIILTQNQLIFELAHDLLFRLTLFIYIVVFYVSWFYWASNKKI